MERETGIEPATNSLEGCDSTTELLPPPFWKLENGTLKLVLGRPIVSFQFQFSSFQFPTGGQGRIRTPVARKERQVYSLLPLTARPPVHFSRFRRAFAAATLSPDVPEPNRMTFELDDSRSTV